MLVANPSGGPNLADRKPRVISEIRKVNVQRSPSLDGHPKLSGILNYYSDGFGIWTQRTVAVRDGSLLVYESNCSPYDYTPARSYASLGRNTTPIRLPMNSAYFDYKPARSRIKDQDQPASLDSPQYFDNKNDGCNSLGRIKGGAEFRLPLRHLNLMPSTLAPRAFCLSYRQNGNAAIPVAIFQALSQLEYERWVKTLAVEIMRQTPLEALRFLDVLGIAAISTPTIPETIQQCKKTSQDLGTRWDRSPSSEGSTTSTDFIFRTCTEETPARSKKSNTISQPFTRRKLQMSDVESQSDREDPITDVKSNGRRSREKMRRSRDGFTNGSSSEDTRAPDEGIVIEERGSSSDRSCRRALWSSDRSDILDSPRSISSYSSYEYGDSPDAVDGSAPLNKTVETLVPSNSSMHLYRAQPFINESSPEPESEKESEKESERFVKKVEFNAIHCSNDTVDCVDKTTPLIVVDPIQPWEPNALKENAWNRARSCSPNNMGSRSPPRFSSSGRGTRALSLGQEYLTVPDSEDNNVEVLKQRCQNSDNYVPVREKLALFESLCRVSRLARSSEELAAIDKSNCTAPRARSLHDLTRSRSPQVPVKEMCKFFEKISNVKPDKPSVKRSKYLFEKYENRISNKDKYLKHKRNDCSNINKDSAFDKTVKRQGEMDSDKLDDMDSERSKYANFTQIRQGNKIITYV